MDIVNYDNFKSLLDIEDCTNQDIDLIITKGEQIFKGRDLGSRDLNLFIKKHGLGGHPKSTYRALSKEHKLSGARVLQICNNMKRKFRRLTDVYKEQMKLSKRIGNLDLIKNSLSSNHYAMFLRSIENNFITKDDHEEYRRNRSRDDIDNYNLSSKLRSCQSSMSDQLSTINHLKGVVDDLRAQLRGKKNHNIDGYNSIALHSSNTNYEDYEPNIHQSTYADIFNYVNSINDSMKTYILRSDQYYLNMVFHDLGAISGICRSMDKKI